MKFAVIGGDMRQARLAEFLAEDGHLTDAYAVQRIKSDKVTVQKELTDAVDGADCIILPLPAISNPGVINTHFGGIVLTARELFSKVQSNQIICAGRADTELKNLALDAGTELVDYFAREELQVQNAVLTAEGALKIIMEETSWAIMGAKCLVLGFGRIGKILANRLHALGADVTVTARKHADIAWIRAYGYKSEFTDMPMEKFGEYDVIVNTIPSQILDENRLKYITKECLCLDLASRPGGIDFPKAAEMGLRVIWALSLPGEIAPDSAGMCIKDTIYNILREKGVEV